MLLGGARSALPLFTVAPSLAPRRPGGRARGQQANNSSQAIATYAAPLTVPRGTPCSARAVGGWAGAARRGRWLAAHFFYALPRLARCRPRLVLDLLAPRCLRPSGERPPGGGRHNHHQARRTAGAPPPQRTRS